MAIIQDDADRRLSADGELGADPSSAASGSSQHRPPSDTPYSPRPHLFDNLPSSDGPVASDVLTEADYRRMRADAFSPRNIAPPIVASGVLAYLAPSVLKTKPQAVGIVRTGIFTVALAFTLSYTTYSHLSAVISSARSRAQHAALPRTADGQVLLPDPPATPESAVEAPSAPAASPPPLSSLQKELASLGRPKERSRWAKGKGLVGEVEEEEEMRDSYLRPGVPRREV